METIIKLGSVTVTTQGDSTRYKEAVIKFLQEAEKEITKHENEKKAVFR